jgi:opacity protein-like surface antigen
MRRALVLAAIMAGAVAADAAAQAVQRPSRPSRGLFGGGPAPTDPNRTRQELTLTGSFLGGYEDFIVPGSTVGETVNPARNGTAYSGTGSGSLRYWRGRTLRSFSVNASAQSSMYSLANIDPTFGANIDLAGTTQAGRKNTIGVTQLFAYEPSLAFGVFGPITQTVAASELPGGGVGSPSLDQTSWSSVSALNAQRRVTTRQTATGTFTYLSRRFLNDLGYDSDTRSADGHYSWNVTRTTAIDATYRYSQSSVEDPDGRGLPLKDQTVNLGLSYSKRLSPTRQIHFSGGAGATNVQTQEPLTRDPLEYWTPAGNGMVRLDLGRTWAVGVDYRRAVSVLPGITLQSFATDAASVRANGRLGNRIEVVLSGAFSNGRAGYGEQPSRYESYSGTAQLHFAVSRCCATTVNYDYYYYKLHAVTNVPTGIPNEYDRNTLRVGLSVWVPLFGTFAGGERGSGR